MFRLPSMHWWALVVRLTFSTCLEVISYNLWRLCEYNIFLNLGEVINGTLALIEKGTPIIVTASQHHLLDKTTSNVQEVKARGAYVIAVGDSNSKKLQDISNDYITLPEASEMLSTVISIIPLQFIAYHVANLNGESIDQPRNLAKSVTVE